MPRKAKPQEPVRVFSTRSLISTRGMLQKAINTSDDSATVTIPIGLAVTLVEVVRALEHTERNLQGPETVI